MTNSQIEALAEKAERETADYLWRRSSLHLEAAIASLLDVMDPDGVATYLEEQAAQLREFG